MLIVACILADRKTNHELFLQSNFTELLLLYSSAVESGLQAPADVRNFGTAEPSDLQLKRLMWSLLSELSLHEGNLRLIQQSQFLPTLLFYLTPDDGSKPHILQYAPGKQYTLTLEAFSALFNLVPRCPKVCA